MHSGHAAGIPARFESRVAGKADHVPFVADDAAFIPDHCENGSVRRIDGVVLSSTANPRVRVAVLTDTSLPPPDLFHDTAIVRAPTGLLVRDDAGHEAKFAASQCRVFEVDVHELGWSRNRVTALAGSLRVVCAHEGAPALIGSMSFTGCTQ